MKLFSPKPASAQEMQEFVSLLTEHQDTIRLYIRSLVPSHVDPRDILQEVNIMLWQKMHDFKLGTNFGAWACTVAYYAVLNHRKKMKREGFMIFNDELSSVLLNQMSEQEVESPREQMQALTRCLQEVSPDNLKLLQARYDKNGPSVEDLSKETGRSLNTLYVGLSRLRVSLKNCIQGRLAEEGGQA
ncbi:sigma-70 family RNA polymerase sigma factor [Rubritalea tangerina]|uniref:Sigma-70 family RNA polymerase sigma factor n=1 Tax=Rubritalea tangerina TaxID=430798 RepID=A0ABW4ZBT8_9BACT